MKEKKNEPSTPSLGRRIERNLPREDSNYITGRRFRRRSIKLWTNGSAETIDQDCRSTRPYVKWMTGPHRKATRSSLVKGRVRNSWIPRKIELAATSESFAEGNVVKKKGKELCRK